MKNQKGFIISTTLYSIFGIMMITVFYILYILSTNRTVVITSTNQAKKEIETYEDKKVYLNFLGPESELNKISDSTIEALKNELKAQNIVLVTDKSKTDDSKVVSNKQKTSRTQNIIAQEIFTYNMENLNGVNSNSYMEVTSDGLIVISTSNYDRGTIEFFFKNIETGETNNLSINALDNMESLGYFDNKYNEEKNQICVYYQNTRYNSTKHYKTIINLNPLSIGATSSGECSSSFKSNTGYIDSDISNYQYMNFADGAYFEKVDGSTNLLKVTMNGVTDELDIGNASTFTAKLCKDSPNVLSASHMFIKNGSNKFYKITKENNNLNIASSTIGNYNKSSYNMTKTITMNNFYPIPIIDHYSSSYNTSFDNIIDGFSDCQDYSDICINDIDDFKEGINIGHGNYDVGNIKYWTDINDDNIFKRENKLGFLLKVRKGEYKENIMQKVNETYYIIWYDEFQISDFEDNVDKIRTFKVDTTNRDKENYPKYDEEYYIFTTDTAFKDSKGISRLELDSNLEKKINGNSNISKLLFSTDSYVENVFPISDYNFYNSAIDINRIKEIIISDINRN